jgi:hypothetical protein
MVKLARQVLLPVLICETLVVGSAVMFYAFTQKPLGAGARAYLVWAVFLGLIISMSCLAISRVLRRPAAIFVGAILGLLIPIVAGVIWGRIVDPRLYGWNHQWALPQGVNWRGTDAWTAGLQLAIPSTIGGALIGLIQGRRLRESR